MQVSESAKAQRVEGPGVIGAAPQLVTVGDFPVRKVGYHFGAQLNKPSVQLAVVGSIGTEPRKPFRALKIAGRTQFVIESHN